MRSGVATPAQLLRLDRVQLVIAAQQQQRPAGRRRPRRRSVFTAALGRDLQERARARRSCARPACARARSGSRGAGRGAAGATRLRQLDVGRVVVDSSENAIASSPESASTWNSCERAAADAARVGLRPRGTSAAGARRCACTRRTSRGSRRVERGLVDVERVRVLHDEFARRASRRSAAGSRRGTWSGSGRS